MIIIDAKTLNALLTLPALSTFRQLAAPAENLISHAIRNSNLDEQSLEYDIFDLKPSLAYPNSRLTNISRPNMGQRTIVVDNSPPLQHHIHQLMNSLQPVTQQLNDLIAERQFYLSGLRVLRYPVHYHEHYEQNWMLPDHIDESAFTLVSPGSVLRVEGEAAPVTNRLYMMIGERNFSALPLVPTKHRVDVSVLSRPAVSVVAFFDDVAFQ